MSRNVRAVLPLVAISVASFNKEVNPRLAKRPLVFNRRLANRGLTTLVKKATGVWLTATLHYLDIEASTKMAYEIFKYTLYKRLLVFSFNL